MIYGYIATCITNYIGDAQFVQVDLVRRVLGVIVVMLFGTEDDEGVIRPGGTAPISIADIPSYAGSLTNIKHAINKYLHSSAGSTARNGNVMPVIIVYYRTAKEGIRLRTIIHAEGYTPPCQRDAVITIIATTKNIAIYDNTAQGPIVIGTGGG